MSMKARVRTDATGNITIHMEGGMDYENIIPLKEQLAQITSKYPTTQVTLDLASLNFVGSSGIGIFVETIKSINNKAEQIRLSNVGLEFQKVFKLYKFDYMNILIDEFESDDTNLNRFYGLKGRTFQN